MGQRRMARRAAARHGGRATDTHASETEARRVSTRGGRDPLPVVRAFIAEIELLPFVQLSVWLGLAWLGLVGTEKPFANLIFSGALPLWELTVVR